MKIVCLTNKNTKECFFCVASDSSNTDIHINKNEFMYYKYMEELIKYSPHIHSELKAIDISEHEWFNDYDLDVLCEVSDYDEIHEKLPEYFI